MAESLQFIKFKVNNRNARAVCVICLNLTVKTLERRRGWTTLFIFNFKQVNSDCDIPNINPTILNIQFLIRKKLLF